MNSNKNLVELEHLMVKPFHLCLTNKYKQILIRKVLQKAGNFRSLSRLLGCHPSAIRYIRDNDGSHINASLLKRILDLLKIPICQAEKHIISVRRGCNNRAVKIKLPIRPGPELALLLAKTFGDGGISSDWRFHYTNNQLNLMREVINAVDVSIGENKCLLHNRFERKTYEMKFSSVIGFILNFIGGPKGFKVYQEFKIPDWIMNGDKSIKSYFLRGIFDDESNVDHPRRRTRRILFAMCKTKLYENSHREFLQQIQTLLLEFNIQSSNIRIQYEYDDKIALMFGIYKKSNFLNFQKFIDFTHIKKRKILQEMVADYVDKYKVKRAILKNVKTSLNPLTIKEIAVLTNVNRDLAEYHLYNLLKERVITKIDEKPSKWLLN